MAFDFPASPTVGQTFSPAGGPTYIWDGVAWKSGSFGPTVSIADTPPGSPTQGNLWWESDGGALWISYNDGNSTQWVNTNSGVSLPVTADGAVAQGRLDVLDAQYITKLDKTRVPAGTPMFSFSENDLRVTKINASGWYTAVSQPASAAWQMLYYEATIMNIGADAVVIGVCNKNMSLGSFIGAGAYGFGWQGSGYAYCYHAGGYYWNLGRPTFTTGDTLAFAFHIGVSGVWMRNVTAGGNWWGRVGDDPGASPPVSGDGFIGFGYSEFMYNTGPLYAACSLNDVGTSVRFNFDGPFAGTMPTGYKRWRGRA